MSKEYIQGKLANLEARNRALAQMHSDLEQDKYPVSHPQMKQLYNDIAELADLIWNSLEINKDEI